MTFWFCCHSANLASFPSFPAHLRGTSECVCVGRGVCGSSGFPCFCSSGAPVFSVSGHSSAPHSTKQGLRLPHTLREGLPPTGCLAQCHGRGCSDSSERQLLLPGQQRARRTEATAAPGIRLPPMATWSFPGEGQQTPKKGVCGASSFQRLEPI